MNEIKEILDYISDRVIEKEKWNKVKDYITNLQEENQRLKELDENYFIEEQLEEALKYENIYKSRIDKATEYIDRMTRVIDYDDDEFITWEHIEDIENILKGSDNNE